jgi:hypothetical protein
MLVAAALFPVLLFAIGGVVALADRERHGIETGLRDTARSLALGVDKELDSSVTALQALMTSALLQSDDYSMFHEQLAKVRAEARAPWVTAAAIDAAGRVLVSLTPPLDSVFPGPQADSSICSTTGDPGWHRQWCPCRRPPSRRRAARQNRRRWSRCSAGDALTSIVWRHRLAARRPIRPDAKAHRGRGSRRSPGGADDDVATVRRTGWEGVSQFVTASGRSMYAAHARSPEWGWTATLIVPASTVDGSWRRWLAMVIGGGILLLLLGVALALLAARGIASPIAALARSAEALGRGEAARPAPSDVAELEEVGYAIGEAATARLASARELEIRADQQAAIVALGTPGGPTFSPCRTTRPDLCSTWGGECPSSSWAWTARRSCCAPRWAARPHQAVRGCVRRSLAGFAWEGASQW